ncbi:Protein CBG08478 [Caenorhabditis briggsae]|uniref:Up-regulated in Daf-2 domain-containing protein n=2 Tax=Caenorhabditis briggsae TaxID=6238 RepID=A0AAE9DWG8_CAEBR|nr:Protein CBG08478 [Caenorhabditis briggsae]ULU13350.1 hypothetical protein L3Y34_016088 [Caenorhabditis briggsae]UMM14294.1 hypothetical protein L5515_002154 [Caenorhabditis briggsae]CAP28294.1 Protein CBG08478 [Caenorhabditis briggsae]
MSSTPSAEPPQSTRRWAKIVLENCTGSHFKFQVLHEYTGEQTNNSGYILFKPDDKITVFDQVYYNTGFFTTGVDNWKVHGTRLIEVSPESKFTEMISGKFFIDGLPYASGHGAFASWKKHTLRSEDDGQETIIKVYQTEVQFISPSGRSTTTFNTLGQDILPFSANPQQRH